jgi:FdhD protein
VKHAPAGRAVTSAHVLAVRGDHAAAREEALAGEEPLQLRAGGPGQVPVDVAVTMRTPGHEEELAAGFLVTEGLVTQDELAAARFELADPGGAAQPENEITVRLAARFDPARVPDRAFVATASCGICGKASIDDVARRCPPLPAGTPAVLASMLPRLPDAMRRAQEVFSSTGSLHAAALFAPNGGLAALREDVGRHNALDKLVGAAALAGELPLHGNLLLVSGRVSFEIVQKAAMAGIPFVAAVGGPSDLAVATAQRLGMTLVGFLRGKRFNVYSGTERVRMGR